MQRLGTQRSAGSIPASFLLAPEAIGPITRWLVDGVSVDDAKLIKLVLDDVCTFHKQRKASILHHFRKVCTAAAKRVPRSQHRLPRMTAQWRVLTATPAWPFASVLLLL
jgi:hypothetical protein